MRRLAALIVVGVAAFGVGALATCTDRTETVVDRVSACESFCAAEERCFPGIGGFDEDYINARDYDECMVTCTAARDWDYADCAKATKASHECLAALSCEDWLHRKSTSDPPRPCEEELRAMLTCRSEMIDYSE